MLTETRIRGFVGMVILLVASLNDWLAGRGNGKRFRKAMALTTSLRNVGVGLVIVTGSFTGTPPYPPPRLAGSWR